MNYKIWNFLFGWDYIYWQNSADNGIARVMKLPDGKVVYWRYKLTKLMDIITDKNQVRWLTCPPKKIRILDTLPTVSITLTKLIFVKKLCEL